MTTGNRQWAMGNGLLVLLAVPTIALAQNPTPAPPPPAPAPEAVTPPPASPPPAMVRPGMSEAEVRAAWGEPDIVRHANEWTYLMYRNYDERHVGYLDTVFLQNGQVVDCITRSPGHIYAGQSSSPPDRVPERTLPATQPDTTRPAVTGVRINP